MSNLAGAVTLENEIVKATDFQFSHDQQIKNIALVLKTIVAGGGYNFILGGSVSPYTNGGMNVQADALLAYDDKNEIVGIETGITKPISVEAADDTLDRKDIVQVQIQEEGYDEQSRAFIDPDTKVKTFEHISTKKKVVLNISVKKGANGSEIAPTVDEGFVKIAEISVPAGTVNITEDLIENVSSRVAGGENSNWTADKKATFAPVFLASLLQSFLAQHNEDGTHKEKAIAASMLKFGTEADSINASLLPVGESLVLNGEKHESVESTKELAKAIVTFCNGVYAYANDIFSRYSYLSDVPVAASTENVNVTEGGEMTLDGIAVSAGQIVFLKNQTDKKENGFWVVQTGSWNRAANYAETMTSFDHKFVYVKNGTQNARKVFYLAGDTYKIGTDELDFAESNFASDPTARKFVIRDENGRAKMAEPSEEDDIAIKATVTAEENARKEYERQITAHYDSCDGRNLLDVLGVDTVAEAMEALHKRCNGTGTPDFSGLMVGDYLDLPSLTVDGTTYQWNSSYKNLRIVISGFNQYIGVGDTENTKNHILWTFRNVVLKRQMNSSDNNAGGYPASALKTFLDGVFTAGLAAALGGSYLYTVRRATSVKGSVAWNSFTVFLPTTVEVFGIDTYGDDQNGWNTNVQFPIFRNSSFYRIKRYDGQRMWWWLGTPHASNSSNFCAVGASGNSYNRNASVEGGVAPAFCTC